MLVRSALLATHRVRRSHEGITCWGALPTLNLSTTLSVTGSITETSLERRFGTYTRSRSPFTAAATAPAAASATMMAARSVVGVFTLVPMAGGGGARFALV